MISIDDVCRQLEALAPASLAAEWDNVGLLVGDRRRPVQRIMTCLTLTSASAAEAVARQVDLVVTHHPLPFRPFKRITTDTHEGRLLLDLIAAGVGVYSAHTAFDSAEVGINQRLAEGLALQAIAPMVADTAPPGGLPAGSGRWGWWPTSHDLAEVVDRLKRFLRVGHVKRVGAADKPIQSVALACGSAGEYLAPARAAGCDLLITGETSFHTCLEAESAGMALLLTGHFASERFGVENLAEELAARFRHLEVWASREERDPIVWC